MRTPTPASAAAAADVTAGSRVPGAGTGSRQLDNFLTTYCTNLAALRKRHGLAPMDTADAMESDDIASATSSQAGAFRGPRPRGQ